VGIRAKREPLFPAQPLPTQTDSCYLADSTLMSLFPLRGIPPAAFDYRLGNRSALNWVPNQEPDQYRVSTDPRSTTPPPEGEGHDERYILRHIGLVITVSLETQRSSPSCPPSISRLDRSLTIFCKKPSKIPCQAPKPPENPPTHT
jgi:hypothetical protein